MPQPVSLIARHPFSNGASRLPLHRAHRYFLYQPALTLPTPPTPVMHEVYPPPSIHLAQLADRITPPLLSSAHYHHYSKMSSSPPIRLPFDAENDLDADDRDAHYFPSSPPTSSMPLPTTTASAAFNGGRDSYATFLQTRSRVVRVCFVYLFQCLSLMYACIYYLALQSPSRSFTRSLAPSRERSIRDTDAHLNVDSSRGMWWNCPW